MIIVGLILVAACLVLTGILLLAFLVFRTREHRSAQARFDVPGSKQPDDVTMATVLPADEHIQPVPSARPPLPLPAPPLQLPERPTRSLASRGHIAVMLGAAVALLGACGIGSGLVIWLAVKSSAPAPVAGPAAPRATSASEAPRPPAVVVPPKPLVGEVGTLAMPNEVVAGAFSPDGQTLALADYDGCLVLWDVASARERVRLPATERIGLLVYSPDGRWLATGQWFSNVVKLRDAFTGTQRSSLSVGQSVSQVSFSPDSKSLVSVRDHRIVSIWDLANGTEKMLLRSGRDTDFALFQSATYTPDGKRLFLAGQGGLRRGGRDDRFLDLATATEVNPVTAFRTAGVDARVLLAPDGRRVVLAPGLGGFGGGAENNMPLPIRIWDAGTQKEAPALPGTARVACLAFAPDDETLAVGYVDGTVKLWDLDTSRELASFTAVTDADGPTNFPANGMKGDPKAVPKAWFSPDGKLLVTRLHTKVRLWDVPKVLGRALKVTRPLPPPPPKVDPDPLVRAEAVRELTTVRLGEERIYALSVSPDGQHLATASLNPREASTVRLFDPMTLQETSQFAGLGPLVFTADNTCLVYREPRGPKGPEYRLWDVRARRTLPGGMPCFRDSWRLSPAVASAPDGRTILMSNETVLTLYDVPALRALRTLKEPDPRLNALEFSPDGRLFAVAHENDSRIRICDAATGKTRWTCAGHTNFITALAFSPDGKRLASVAGWDAGVKLWDVSTAKQLVTLEGHSQVASHLAFARDARLLASAGTDKTVRLWDIVKEKALLTLKLPAHDNDSVRVAFMPDGRHLVAAFGPSLRQWDVSQLVGPAVEKPAPVRSDEDNRPEVPIVKASVFPQKDGQVFTATPGDNGRPCGEVNGVAISPDGRWLVAGHGSTESWTVGGGTSQAMVDCVVRVWDVQTGREARVIRTPKWPVHSLGFTPDGRSLITGGGGSGVVEHLFHNFEKGSLVRQLVGHRNPVHAVTVLADGRRGLSVGEDGTLQLWNLETGEKLSRFQRKGASLTCLAVSPDQRRALTGGQDKTVQLWDLATGEFLQSYKGHEDTVTGVAFLGEGRRCASSSLDGSIRIWNVEDGRELRVIPGEAGLKVTCLAVSPDGRLLLSGGMDKMVRLWSADTGKLLRSFEGHEKAVKAVAFWPGGEWAVSGGADKTVRAWRLAAQK